MYYRYWLRDADSDIPAWCPWDEEQHALVVGLTMISDKPPHDGIEAGTFRYSDAGWVADWAIGIQENQP
jgi:hypothetical protein